MAAALLRSLVVSLLLTELFEFVSAFLLGARVLRDFLLVFLVNLVTNPVVGLLFDGVWLFCGRLPPWYLILAAEAAAVVAEALLYRNRLEYKKLPPILFSLILNFISYFGGVLFEKLIETV